MYIESKYKKAGVLFLIQLVILIAVYVYSDVILGNKFSTAETVDKVRIFVNGISLLIIAVSMFLKCHWGVAAGSLAITVTHFIAFKELFVKMNELDEFFVKYFMNTEQKLLIYFKMAYLILVPLAYIIISLALFANTSAQRMKGFASLAGLCAALGSLPYTGFILKNAIEVIINYGKKNPELTTKHLIFAIIILVGTLCLIAGIATAAGAYIVKAKEYRRMNHQEDMYSQDAYNTDSNNTYGGSRYYNPASAHPQSTDATQTAQTTQTGPKFYTPFANDSASTDEVAEQGYYNPNATVDNNNFDPYAPIDK